MAIIFNVNNTDFTPKQSPIPEFAWHTSERLASVAGSKHLIFDIRSLDPGKYSYPYHFHRNAEEIFVMIEGKAMLRTPEGIQELSAGDIVFFETGPEGAHQLYNHTGIPCRYFDLRTNNGLDVAEYPDSGKINILPYEELYQSADRVDYYKGEDKTREQWERLAELKRKDT
ncbi:MULTISPECIES: cupin domain-containing protein [unclassified Paenibacillus]|nr:MULTISPECIES: cupin domain-containing protein [unclassified Paenibacillus]MDF9845138.1 putative cupin superfamily protein [Paenibacillus sp. PastF-2]MDF9851737.1 putative cupin superfamily protein [Paenibacillus sp. PastM-2]MDF9858310.1 putative cupin superfamily protein [Paenibacillus sp. PastF-1]MDH6483610.1 putative cupin superfamily protein [Paenibacillus sp. PastH-2]MDH6510985.1 putative cupin superfamily protein [Paenibacillus sp. PastM-3]